MNPARRTLSQARPRKQRGVVLMIALIVLVALTLAGLSMIRSADTGVIVAGNLSFRQSGAQALDVAVDEAIRALPGDLAFSMAPIPDKYFPSPLEVDQASGLPIGVNWNAAYVVNSTAIPTGYTVRYIIERLCRPDTPPAIDSSDPKLRIYCNVEFGQELKSSKFGTEDLGQLRKIHYNITVKVEGPRNTEIYARALASK